MATIQSNWYSKVFVDVFKFEELSPTKLQRRTKKNLGSSLIRAFCIKENVKIRKKAQKLLAMTKVHSVIVNICEVS